MPNFESESIKVASLEWHLKLIKKRICLYKTERNNRNKHSHSIYCCVIEGSVQDSTLVGVKYPKMYPEPSQWESSVGSVLA